MHWCRVLMELCWPCFIIVSVLVVGWNLVWPVPSWAGAAEPNDDPPNAFDCPKADVAPVFCCCPNGVAVAPKPPVCCCWLLPKSPPVWVVVLLPNSPPLDWVVAPPKPVPAGLKADEAPNEVLEFWPKVFAGVCWPNAELVCPNDEVWVCCPKSPIIQSSLVL